MSKRFVLLILAGIIIIAVATRFYGLDRQSFWYDEVFEENDFYQQFLEDHPKQVTDTPPLNSLIVYLVAKAFPKNDLALRLIPFTFGSITILIFFLLGRLLFNENIGLLSAFLLSISPFHIWYSQDIRMYSLHWLLVLISMIYFIRALKQPVLQNYIGYLISTTAGLYTLQLTIFIMIAQALYLLIFFQKYKSHLIKWGAIFLMTILLFTPYIIYTFLIFAKQGRPTGFLHEVDLKVIPYTIYSFSVGYSIGPSLRELHLDRSYTTISPYLKEIVSIASIYGTLFMLGLWSIRKDYQKLILMLLFMIVPIISVLALNKIMHNIAYNSKYAGISLFAYLLFLANGINLLTQIKSMKLGKLLATLAIVVTFGFSTYSYANYQFNKKYHKEDIREAVSYIKEKKLTGDVVLCISDTTVFNRYSGVNFQCSPIFANDKVMVDTEMHRLVEGKKRLWLMLSREWVSGNLWRYVKEWLDTNYEEIKQLHKGLTEIANVQIYCYDLMKAKTQDIRFPTEGTEKKIW